MRTVFHKYKAKPQVDDGHHFASKKEHKYFQELKLRQKAGEVIFFLRQVPFHLPGGIKYVIDFLEFHSDGTVKIIDVKGVDTVLSKTKRKMVEELYPVNIETV